MTIFKSTAESNGAYANQSGEFNTIPDGYYSIPDELQPLWEQYKPFITPTIENGVITAIADNPTARAAQQAADATAQTKAKTAALIADLEAQIASTDYKIIKCYEYSLTGLAQPYDIATLHTDRQAIRDQINKLKVTETTS